ncbi:PREDICTED: DNA damage-regulated autophagy modulator protein 1 [Nanorana parkeri]|uniref:DNA damage-regulated autophagy modulator protein 1 n=1 Tax=Nanorana parkeri TaxID=125878 RepID=UPI00085460C6|nr:PREDICTED: DNA damage-regulated autophagy modulator protein 1 [Nanorana parkeri]
MSRINKSDTGTCIPESGLFGFMISVSAMLGAATMYVRYKIVLVQNSRSAFLCRYFNIMSLVIGVIGCIGMGIVASFQETSVTKVHDIGALLAFIFGVLYISLQSIISYKSCPEWNRRGTCCIRMFISLLSILAVFPMIICASFAGIGTFKCEPGEEPSPYRQASAVCEWIVAFGFVTYFLTFIKDFQAITLTISTELHDDF